MKYFFFILISLCLLNSHHAWSQVENQRTASINKIRRQIDVDKSLKKMMAKGDLSHLPSDLSNKRLTGYYRDSLLVKMILQARDTNGMELFTYYYDHHQLICVYNEFQGPLFDSTGKRVPNKYESNFTGWYYFSHGALIDEISTGHNRFENDEIDAGEVLPKEAAECRRILTTHQSGRK